MNRGASLLRFNALTRLRCTAAAPSRTLAGPCTQLNHYQPLLRVAAVRRALSSRGDPGTLLPRDDVYRDQNDTWVDRTASPALRPYLKLMRLDRPIGTYLVLLPGLWGLALASPMGSLPDLWLSALFVSGAFIMRGAGCTVNDMWDRRFDSQVARTAARPLANNRLSMLAAWTFLGAQLSAGLAILLQLNWPTIELGVLCVPLVMLYPAMKRFTHLPQVALGAAMNYGILMGSSAVLGGVAWGSALPLYAGAACWTVVYDTIYAHQDRKDDAKLGLKSTALLFGASTVPILSAVSVAAGALWTVSGLAAGLAAPYYAAVAASTAHMLWQVTTADYEDRTSLTRRFVSNQWIGFVMLLGIVAGKLVVV